MFDSIMAVYAGKLAKVGSESNAGDEEFELKCVPVTGTAVRKKLDSSAFSVGIRRRKKVFKRMFLVATISGVIIESIPIESFMCMKNLERLFSF